LYERNVRTLNVEKRGKGAEGKRGPPNLLSPPLLVFSSSPFPLFSFSPFLARVGGWNVRTLNVLTF
jgi:hypothetical protein